jgi:hypothetical protein
VCFLKLNNFHDLVQTSRTFIGALVITGFVGKMLRRGAPVGRSDVRHGAAPVRCGVRHGAESHHKTTIV